MINRKIFLFQEKAQNLLQQICSSSRSSPDCTKDYPGIITPPQSKGKVRNCEWYPAPVRKWIHCLHRHTIKSLINGPVNYHCLCYGYSSTHLYIYTHHSYHRRLQGIFSKFSHNSSQCIQWFSKDSLKYSFNLVMIVALVRMIYCTFVWPQILNVLCSFIWEFIEVNMAAMDMWITCQWSWQPAWLIQTLCKVAIFKVLIISLQPYQLSPERF